LLTAFGNNQPIRARLNVLLDEGGAIFMHDAQRLLSGATSPPENASDIPVMLTDMLKNGLSVLWRGFEYARDLDRERWAFAVEFDELIQLGLSTIDLRWLVFRGYVDYASNGTLNSRLHESGSMGCSFESGHTAFVLTSSGASLVLQILTATSHVPSRSILYSENGASSLKPIENGHVEISLAAQQPRWDRERKELYYRGSIVKQFKWPAANQETILMAFEEEGWPKRIDDPLPRKPDMDPINRLHDTIKCLNRNHKKRLLRFSGDGTGEGILWNHLESVESDS
jgi:hypothetical protein